MPDQGLRGVKVLDLSHHIAGPYCAKMLADFGAEVIKVERPGGGDPARRAGPFPSDIPDPDASGLFLYLNNNKKSITLNLKTGTGVSIFKDLVSRSDILVENFRPRVLPGMGLGYDSLRKINPGLVMTSISNFGQTGPYRDYEATEIVVQAIGGWVYGRGEPDREPLRAGGLLRLGEYIGGMFAATGTMTGLALKRLAGAGQHIDVSLMESVHMMMCYPVAMRNFPRSTNNWERRTFCPGPEECRDGYVGINTLTGAHWRDLCKMMGMDDWAEDPEYMRSRTRFPRRHEIRERMHGWLMERSGEQVLLEGHDWRVPVAPVYATSDIMESPQYVARDYFVSVEHDRAGRLAQPGAPFKMAKTPWRISSAAPRLGEHNRDVYCDILGYGKQDLVRLGQAGII